MWAWSIRLEFESKKEILRGDIGAWWFGNFWVCLAFNLGRSGLHFAWKSQTLEIPHVTHIKQDMQNLFPALKMFSVDYSRIFWAHFWGLKFFVFWHPPPTQSRYLSSFCTPSRYWGSKSYSSSVTSITTPTYLWRHSHWLSQETNTNCSDCCKAVSWPMAPYGSYLNIKPFACCLFSLSSAHHSDAPVTHDCKTQTLILMLQKVPTSPDVPVQQELVSCWHMSKSVELGNHLVSSAPPSS